MTLPPSRTGFGDVDALDAVVVAVGGAGADVVTGALVVVAVVVLGAVVLADDCVGGGVAVDGGVVVGTLVVGAEDDGTDVVLAGVELLVRVGAVVRDVEADRVFGCVFDADFDFVTDVEVDPDFERDVEADTEVEVEPAVDVVDDAGAVVVAGVFVGVR